jgi:hypothetical protein
VVGRQHGTIAIPRAWTGTLGRALLA